LRRRLHALNVVGLQGLDLKPFDHCQWEALTHCSTYWSMDLRAAKSALEWLLRWHHLPGHHPTRRHLVGGQKEVYRLYDQRRHLNEGSQPTRIPVMAPPQPPSCRRCRRRRRRCRRCRRRRCRRRCLRFRRCRRRRRRRCRCRTYAVTLIVIDETMHMSVRNGLHEYAKITAA
jgi:hypothetical protein